MSTDLTKEHLLGTLWKLTQIKSNIAWFLKVVEEKKVVEKMVVEEKKHDAFNSCHIVSMLSLSKVLWKLNK